MLGAITGDIVGSKYEFNNTFDYDFEMFGEGSDFTDDSICTMAVADAILNQRSYKDSLLDWCRRYPRPKGAYGGGFQRWIHSSSPQPYNSFGNGSAMRVSPVAWLFEDAIRLAISHGGDSDTIGAIVGSIAEARFGIPQEIKDKVKSYLPEDMKQVFRQFEDARKS